jgi:IS5 family transposase
MENRNGLVVDAVLTQATGTAEREAALSMLANVPGQHRITLGADKNYDTANFVNSCRDRIVTPHVACRETTILDRRTTRHQGYEVSQRIRKRVEEIFGWLKTVGGGRKLRYKGTDRNQFWMDLAVAAYDLVRIAKLALNETAG